MRLKDLDEEKQIDLIKKRWEASRKNSENRKAKRDTLLQLYRGKPAPRKDPTAPNVFPNDVLPCLETIKAKVIMPFFADPEDYVFIYPSDEETPRENAKKMRNLVIKYLREIDWKITLHDVISAASKFSLGLFKDGWNFQEEEVAVSKKRPVLEPIVDAYGLPQLSPEDGMTPMMQQAVDEKGSPAWEDYKETTILRKDRPKIEYVPEDEFAICPDDIDIQTADTRCLYLAHKPKAVTKQFLLDQVALGIFDKKATNSILHEDDAEGGHLNKVEDPKKEADDIKEYDKEEWHSQSPEEYELYEYQEFDCIAVMGVGKKEAMVRPPEENPYNHKQYNFGKINFIREEDDFFGLGGLELVEALQLMENRLANAKLDMIRQQLTAPILAAKNFLDKGKKNLEFGMNKVNELNLQGRSISEVITRLITPNLSDMSIFESNNIRNHIQNILGASDLTGMTTNTGNVAPKTKFEVQSKTAQAESRFALFLALIAQEIERLLKRMISNIQQFLIDDIQVKIADKNSPDEWKIDRITRENIQGNFDLYVLVDPMQAQAMEMRQDFFAFLEMSAKYPMLARMIEPAGIANVVEQVFGNLEMAGFFKSEEKLAQEAMQEQAMQMAMMQDQQNRTMESQNIADAVKQFAASQKAQAGGNGRQSQPSPDMMQGAPYGI